jgi:ABC-type glutathione transport system ATPase component
MLSEVRNYYGLARDFGQTGYFETEHSEQIVSELKLEIKAGKLVALSGIVGCGKTTILTHSRGSLPRQGDPGIQVALVGKEPNQPRHFDHGAILRSGYGEGFQDPHSARTTGARTAGPYQKAAEADRPVHRRRA